MSENGFPTLYVPRTVRRPLAFEQPQQTPQSVRELPSRLPMGDLQPETFRKTDTGFEVMYRSGDFSMKMELKGDSIYFDERYKGTELLYYIGVAKMFLGPRMAQLRLGPTEESDQLIGSDLSAIGNIKYAPFGNVMKTGSSNHFPDGFLMSIVIPVAINGSTFQQLSHFFRRLPNDGNPTLGGFMEYGMHAVNYRVGQCSDVPDDPMLLFLWSVERGFLPVAMPELEGSPDNQALTVRRMGYNLVLNVFMRDIFAVVHLLKDAGLIGNNGDSHQEEVAIVSNSYTILGTRDISFFTNDLSRRVFFPKIMSERIDLRTPALTHTEFDRQLNDILARYRRIASDVRTEFNRAVSEATSHGR